jgi:hypothetical protein
MFGVTAADGTACEPVQEAVGGIVPGREGEEGALWISWAT